uniref:RING-type E3 ubiquitin transferase (cysteine targeting) n=1 Tax=Tetraselmis sp. GSL018 TaxID=582737 RepID=A0A061QNC2_9CHLO
MAWENQWQGLKKEASSISTRGEESHNFSIATARSAQLDAQRIDRFFLATTWRGRPTPGMRLLNLRLCSSRAGGLGQGRPQGLSLLQRAAYGALSVGGRYAWLRLCLMAHEGRWGDAAPGSWRRRCWAAIAWAEAGHSLAELANWLDFLRTGRHRNLLERLIGVAAVPHRTSSQRAVSFEFLSRQLAWQEVSALVLTVLPLVSSERLRALAARWSAPRLDGKLSSAGTLLARASKGTDEGCAVCGAEEILTPFRALPCGHVFCYYCLRARTESDPRYCCPLCGSRVEALERAGGDRLRAR